MKTLQNTIILLILATVYACNNSSPNKIASVENENIIKDSVSLSSDSIKDTLSAEENMIDTITHIKFQEFLLSINSLIISDQDKKISKIQNDTVNLYAEIGETIENQQISISTDQLTNLTIEQRYETSVTIMQEGPHCDLTEWKHFYSDWKQLHLNLTGQFICDKYSEKDAAKFPKITIEELKEKVKEHCGEEWYNLISKIKSATEYPSSVNISRYFLRISGKRINNGQSVTKIIIIDTPMGC